MSVGKHRRNRLLLGSLLVLTPMITLAGPPPADSDAAAGRCDGGFHGPAHPPGSPAGPGPGGGGWGGGEDNRPPPFMMDLSLTEDQQDKVFAILHAAAPALRDREKAARKARDALHELVRSSSFNESSAATLAQVQGSAESQLALLRTRMEHDVYSLLTPEQQARLAAREKECDFRGHGGPPPR